MGLLERIPMPRLLSPLFLVLILAAGSYAAGAENQITVTQLFDLRVRQEVMDGVLFFLPDPDRNQVRFRTRAGVSIAKDAHTFKLLLANEHRRYIHPDNLPFDWDELIIDQLFWSWKTDQTKLTLGRQNIIWDEGFIMLEGKPYDGSRSIFHDAVRVEHELDEGKLEADFIYNLKRDPVVLAGDADLRLRDADETALAVRFEKGTGAASYIFKAERDPDHLLPDLTTHTLDLGMTRGQETGTRWRGEFAAQYQIWGENTSNLENRMATALYSTLGFNLGKSTRGKAGLFAYSETFRTPWGRWPMWSDLYIYTLIGESTPNRVNVAGWKNIAAPFAGVSRPLSSAVEGKFTAYYLLTPNQNFSARGLLLETRLDFKLNARFSGHLLWEMLDPGGFHEAGTPPITEAVHFLRWEIIFKL